MMQSFEHTNFHYEPPKKRSVAHVSESKSKHQKPFVARFFVVFFLVCLAAKRFLRKCLSAWYTQLVSNVRNAMQHTLVLIAAVCVLAQLVECYTHYDTPLFIDYSEQDRLLNTHKIVHDLLETYLDKRPSELCASALDVDYAYHHIIMRSHVDHDSMLFPNKALIKASRLHSSIHPKGEYRHFLNPRVFNEWITTSGENISSLDMQDQSESSTHCTYVYKHRSLWWNRMIEWIKQTWVSDEAQLPVTHATKTKRFPHVRAEYNLSSISARINESFFAEHATCLQHFSDIWHKKWNC
jgi:hypothetical protein